MAKKSLLFFSHDYNVRTDTKIKNLIRKWKMEGYGVYWSIVEDLYNNANALPTHFDVIADELKVSEEMVRSIVNDFDLFKIKGKMFFSPSAAKRLKAIEEKSIKAKESALSRWNNNDANAKPSDSERNATKRNKKKQNIIKLKEIESLSDFEKIEKLKSQKNYDPLPDEFIIAWQLWIENKKTKFKNEQTEKMAREEFLEMSNSDPAIAMKIVKKALTKNWAGLYALNHYDLKNPESKQDQITKDRNNSGMADQSIIRAEEERKKLLQQQHA